MNEDSWRDHGAHPPTVRCASEVVGRALQGFDEEEGETLDCGTVTCEDFPHCFREVPVKQGQRESNRFRLQR